MTDSVGLDETGGRPFAAALAVVMAAGFLLRVWNLGSGIPFAVGIDEPAIMTTVVRILKSGNFNPHFFEYPTGYIYVQLGTASRHFPRRGDAALLEGRRAGRPLGLLPVGPLRHGRDRHGDHRPRVPGRAAVGAARGRWPRPRCSP